MMECDRSKIGFRKVKKYYLYDDDGFVDSYDTIEDAYEEVKNMVEETFNGSVYWNECNATPKKLLHDEELKDAIDSFNQQTCAYVQEVIELVPKFKNSKRHRKS